MSRIAATVRTTTQAIRPGMARTSRTEVSGTGFSSTFKQAIDGLKTKCSGSAASGEVESTMRIWDRFMQDGGTELGRTAS